MLRQTLALAAILLAGCATTSSIMPAGEGVYTVTSRAAPARGGTVGANELAYQKAEEFCRIKGQHAVVVGNEERDVYQYTALAYSKTEGNRPGYSSSVSGAGEGSAASGVARLYFTCGE